MRLETLRFDVPLLPFIERRKLQEAARALRARTPRGRRIKPVPVRYPSVNTMYPINKRIGRKYLSPEGELYKDYIYEALLQQSETYPSYHMYDISYVYFMTHDMMYTKGGELSEHDVSNFLKATEDALFDWLMESDRSVMSIHGHKRLTVNEPKIVILISESKENDLVFHRGESFDPYDLEVRGAKSFSDSL